MNAEQRVRLAIGDLVIQLQAALARIAELEQEMAKAKEQTDTAAKLNGGEGASRGQSIPLTLTPKEPPQ